MSKTENVPYFIQVRGCINCDASKAMKEKHGTDYGFDHEIIVQCILLDCVTHGHDLMKPFIDPEEIVRLVKTNPSADSGNNARKILQGYEESFGVHFKEVGVDLQKLIDELEEL